MMMCRVVLLLVFESRLLDSCRLLLMIVAHALMLRDILRTVQSL
jgi:hypothetical protein